MNKQRTLSTFVLALALVAIAACARESEQPGSVTTRTDGTTSTAPPATGVEKRDHALVRIMNALPGQAVDGFADETKVFSNISYKTVTPYKEIGDDRFTFRIRPSGKSTAEPLAENSEDLDGGEHYTLIVLPTPGLTTDGAGDMAPGVNGLPARERRTKTNASLRVLSDNLTPPPAGQAKVRFIHAASNTDEVNVYIKGREEALFDGVNFTTETMYNEIDPISGTLEIRPENKRNVLLTTPVSFEAGKIYTIILTGTKGKLEAVKIEDQLQGEARSAAATSTTND